MITGLILVSRERPGHYRQPGQSDVLQFASQCCRNSSQAEPWLDSP